MVHLDDSDDPPGEGEVGDLDLLAARSGVQDVQGGQAKVADGLGVHVLHSLQDLLDQPGDLDLSDVPVGFC